MKTIENLDKSNMHVLYPSIKTGTRLILNCDEVVYFKQGNMVFKELDKKGVYVMLSNHNTTLINEIYKDFNIHVIEAKRNINFNGKKRGKVEEVIITNFENKKGFE